MFHVVSYVFSNETFPFFAKLDWTEAQPVPPGPAGGLLTEYFTHSETNFQTALKTGHLISTKLISAFVHGLKQYGSPV